MDFEHSVINISTIHEKCSEAEIDCHEEPPQLQKYFSFLVLSYFYIQ